MIYEYISSYDENGHKIIRCKPLEFRKAFDLIEMIYKGEETWNINTAPRIFYHLERTYNIYNPLHRRRFPLKYRCVLGGTDKWDIEYKSSDGQEVQVYVNTQLVFKFNSSELLQD